MTRRFFSLLLHACLSFILRKLWLDCKHVVLRRNGTFFSQQAQAITAIIQQSGSLGHVLRNNAELGKKTENKRLRLAHPRVSGPKVPTQALEVAPPRKCVSAVPALNVTVSWLRKRAVAYSLSPYAMKSKCSFTSKPAFARAT